MSLKKSIPIFCALFVLCANSAQARVYAGLEVQANKINYKKVSGINLGDGTVHAINSDDYYATSFTAFPAFFAGYDNDQNLKIELSYARISGNKKNDSTGLVWISDSAPVTTKTDTKLNIIGLDFKPYIKQDNLTMFAILGASLVKSDLKEEYMGAGEVRASAKDSTTTLGGNIGLGVEYEFYKNVTLRAQGKYIYLNSNAKNVAGVNGIRDIVSAGLGLAFYF